MSREPSPEDDRTVTDPRDVPAPTADGGTDSAGTTEYRFETTVPTRFRDLDAAGHVHNGVYAVYCEQARIAYLRSVLGIDLTEVSADGAVLANLAIDYRRRITDAAAVDVAAAVTRVGETSLRFEYELRVPGGSGGRGGGDGDGSGDAGSEGDGEAGTGDGGADGRVVAAEAETTLVAVDEGGSRPVPEAWRRAVRAYEPGLNDPDPDPDADLSGAADGDGAGPTGGD